VAVVCRCVALEVRCGLVGGHRAVVCVLQDTECYWQEKGDVKKSANKSNAGLETGR